MSHYSNNHLIKMSWNLKSTHWRFVIWSGDSQCPMTPEKFISTDHLVTWYGNPEYAPTTHRFHWQCHADFDEELRRNQVIKLLDHPITTHYLIANHPEYSRAYCQKKATRVPGMLPVYFYHPVDDSCLQCWNACGPT